MGIQDDIFDIAHALEGKPESELFERVINRFFDMEAICDENAKTLDNIKSGYDALQSIINSR